MNHIGIDFGGTNIVCGLVDDEGRLIGKKSCKTQKERSAEEIMKDMTKLVFDVVSESGEVMSQIDFCGIAAPGTCDPIQGEIIRANNLPAFSRFPIAKDLQRRLGIPKVAVENDANCAALGEAAAGAAKEVSDSVFVTLGTGVGGGVIIGGKLLRGFNFSGAELGHMVVEKDGIACACGRKGCWESYSSATALIRMTKEEMQKHPESLLWQACGYRLENVDGRTAFAAAKKKDAAAQEVLTRFSSYLAVGITNLVNLFQPEILSIGGGISAEGETLIAPVRAILEKEQYSRDCEKKTVLRCAELGNDAGVIGAALLERNL